MESNANGETFWSPVVLAKKFPTLKNVTVGTATLLLKTLQYLLNATIAGEQQSINDESQWKPWNHQLKSLHLTVCKPASLHQLTDKEKESSFQ